MKSEQTENGNEAGGRVTNDRRTTTINKKARCDPPLEQKHTRKAGSVNAKAEAQTRTRDASDSTEKTAWKEAEKKTARRENEKQERDGVDASRGKLKPHK